MKYYICYLLQKQKSVLEFQDRHLHGKEKIFLISPYQILAGLVSRVHIGCNISMSEQ